MIHMSKAYDGDDFMKNRVKVVFKDPKKTLIVIADTTAEESDDPELIRSVAFQLRKMADQLEGGQIQGYM
jgi:SepF-like predicted cell division protein (DUF552 family)